ncbi:MAG: HEAT repeat domain-containing protein [Anaerolineae bacterium]|nr:HEAT repeat domain-containing protein [Anaerolineae bacterium]MCB9129962.1 HEAT repeat domain-containing protein [Anaerolineales bacterium]MCB0238495.1 HEAT repeat domain-containing protein [Anaerolineae bacterium]MCB0245153.1 HEAT repeat domain-containing protein [Anaerolineae bacterium]MCB0247539.1 HEAT repeat domain-containing protein [Anaerolineae bacterium]
MDRELTVQLARITDADPLMRADAARRLSASQDPIAVTALLNALDDGEWRVRAAAVASLGVLGDRRAVFPLCQRLEDPRGDVRRAAAEALAALGDSNATVPLIMALDGERDSETCRLMVRALGTVGDDRALRSLQRLSGSGHWALRREAADSTKKILARGSQNQEGHT